MYLLYVVCLAFVKRYLYTIFHVDRWTSLALLALKAYISNAEKLKSKHDLNLLRQKCLISWFNLLFLCFLSNGVLFWHRLCCCMALSSTWIFHLIYFIIKKSVSITGLRNRYSFQTSLNIWSVYNFFVKL